MEIEARNHIRPESVSVNKNHYRCLRCRDDYYVSVYGECLAGDMDDYNNYDNPINKM